MTNERDDLEDELLNLDIPIVMLDAGVMILCDLFDIGPLTVIDALVDDNDDLIASLKRDHGEKEVGAIMELIWEGLESSTQIPHLRRAIELHLILAQD
jgi:hypothetical protein